jgi:hypothetical protein
MCQNYNLLLTSNLTLVLCNFVANYYLCIMMRVNFDTLGITTTIICAIHCAILPLMLTSLPLFGNNLIDNLAFEYFMIALAAGIGLYSLTHGFKRHHHAKRPILVFSFGILMLLLKQFFHEQQIWFLIPGVIAIISAHLMNIKFCRITGEGNRRASDGCKH